jgi:two-component system response regulator AtoC
MQEDVSTIGPSLDGADPQGELELVVMEQRSLSRYSLGAKRQLSIGRGEDCDIVLRDPLASRLHAVLHVGATLELEDRGSRNGSALKHQALPPGGRATVAVGESMQIGRALLVLQRAASKSLEPAAPVAGFVLADRAMREVHGLVRQLGPGSLSVLITGETGVGKEVVAAALHRASGARSSGPYVRINCAALTEALFESELFGHERGSFTGALRAKPGLLEVADGGTAFLDEVAELPLPAQAKLLRVLESGELLRVGSIKPQAIDVRFVCATNRDLELEVERGNFRQDLFFRLAGCTIFVPPLRERPDELVALAGTFAAAAASRLERPTPHVSDAALSKLRAYGWPGNIRELKNAIEHAVLRSSSGCIEPGDLPQGVLSPGPRRLSPYPGSSAWAPTIAAGRPGETAERERILAALSECNGNQTRAAERLGMPRRTLVAKLGVYGLPRPRKL